MMKALLRKGAFLFYKKMLQEMVRLFELAAGRFRKRVMLALYGDGYGL